MSLNVSKLIFNPVTTSTVKCTNPVQAKAGQKTEQYVQNFASSAFSADAILGGKYTPNFPRNSAELDLIS